ncbi:MAG TPA: iron-containing redox enzyme family protein [Acidimicrobiales bacterium]|nr:iron-containing redox enzyme family protein [Acidimicrobiales bacterium]
MTPPSLATDLVNEAIGDRRLLSHPFYQRWQAGELEVSELTAYAGQYRYFEAQLPDFLAEVLEGAGTGDVAGLLSANLQDETSVPAPHIELFEQFASALGAVEVAPTPATEALVACYRRYARASTPEAVAALAAYEVQAAAVASSKAEGLREFYGLGGEATRFWDVHAAADIDHGTWVVEALDWLLAGDEAAESRAAAATCEVAGAWWDWLDEREAARPAAA